MDVLVDDVTFIYVTVSDVKVRCIVYKILDKSCAARVTEDWRYKLPVDNLYNIQVYICLYCYCLLLVCFALVCAFTDGGKRVALRLGRAGGYSASGSSPRSMASMRRRC